LLTGEREAMHAAPERQHSTRRRRTDMTVGELMERLGEFDPNSEIRRVTQRHYPIESHLLGVSDNEELLEQESGTACKESHLLGVSDNEELLEQESGIDSKENDAIVYLVEGENIGHGRKAAWQQAS